MNHKTIVSVCALQLCPCWWCNLYGAIDSTRMEQCVCHRVTYTTGQCHICERQRTYSIWPVKQGKEVTHSRI